MDRLRLLLNQRGQKLTPQRQAVHQVLTASARSLTPQEIWDEVRQTGHSIGLTSVYRSLDVLGQLGLVSRIHEEPGCHRYIACPTQHHHHLICSECGRVEELTECPLDQWTKSVSQSTHFDIWEHRLELVGRCQRCQEKRKG